MLRHLHDKIYGTTHKSCTSACVKYPTLANHLASNTQTTKICTTGRHQVIVIGVSNNPVKDQNKFQNVQLINDHTNDGHLWLNLGCHHKNCESTWTDSWLSSYFFCVPWNFCSIILYHVWNQLSWLSIIHFMNLQSNTFKFTKWT